MSCPHCQTAIQSGAKFCRQCGRRLDKKCPACNIPNPPGSKFCGECGHSLTDRRPPPGEPPVHDSQAMKQYKVAQGERRHLTILFTDLAGYTELMEENDPEDVQTLMGTVTCRGVEIIEGYKGHIERIIGDGILAVFGLPVTHEDDAIRAIKAAREIHSSVAGLRPTSFRLSRPLAMHTGINTGLTVTAHSAPENGTFDLSGDAVNLASRLSARARPNEILVGPETYRQAYGFFDFKATPPLDIKGKLRPITAYLVQGEKDRPVTGRRKLNLSADLIGRQAELDQLHKAMADLENGKGSIVTIVGEAGTGKSRLLLEFETQMADKRINWIPGYAFSHTQQVPYFPLVHLVRRWLELDGSATEAEMSAGIACRVGELLGADAEEIPIIQGLIGQDVQATASMSPEAWRKRLQSAMLNLLSGIARQAPTVFCMEDIHWGDAASFKLLKDIIFNFQQPAILICTFRPHFSLFTSHEQGIIGKIYHEIRIGELSPSQAEEMMCSMLNTQSLPRDLCRLIRNRAEGNPFYLEEILNALVDSDTLTYKNGRWQLNRAFKETDIPSTIHGVIASRMDQLSYNDKRILQEAAAIGRVFLYEILNRISVYKDMVDASLYKLERAGLISPRALYPEMEFIFKHALIQEVSYGSMLRRERQRVHERIGQTIEEIYQDRLTEFDETLAHHFQKSTATIKATDYLIRSGAKALRRCALDESDQYFKTAKALLEKQPTSPQTKKRLLDVVNQWAFVFYYRGLNRQLLKLLEQQKALVDGLKDPVREGYHWAWHGCALWHRHRFAESHSSLTRALALGQKAKDPYVIGYASTWLSWPCSELGLFDQALENAQRAEALYADGQVKDTYLYFHGLMGQGYAYWHKGDADRTAKIGDRLIKFGTIHSNVRSMAVGYCCRGWRDLIIGDINSATQNFEQAIQISADPWYSQFPKLALCYGTISNGKFEEALPLLDELVCFSDDNGAEFVGDPARFFKGLATILSDHVAQGLESMEALLHKWQAAGCRLRTLTCGYVMAEVYTRLFKEAMQTAEGPDASPTGEMAAKAVQWFQTCIAEAAEMGSPAMEGRAHMGLANIFMLSSQMDAAKKTLSRGIELLDRSNATIHLKHARNLMMPLQTA